MAQLSIDLKGRVSNFDLSRQQPLIPLFETIVNSIYAIEERAESEEFEGKIEIRIIRDPQLVADSLDGIDNSLRDVIGFVVTDNGVGLDDKNMASFLQSDSTYRAAKGGKGVGRFSWLKAFKDADIESVYKDDDVWVKRCFKFSLDESEINDELIEVEEQDDHRTQVSLNNYYSQYGKNVPKSASAIATKIMQHCFIYLMSSKCPKIYVLDDERICINTMFENSIRRDENSIDYNVGEETFSLLHAEVQDASFGSSKLYLFANDRMVREIDLEKEIVDLDKALFKTQGYYYVGVLSGKYLDENVGTTRTSFSIPEDADDEVSISAIVQTTTERVKERLAEYLQNVKEQKESRIRNYIKMEAPQYGHLLKYMPEELAAIRPSLSNAKLDDELYRIKRRFDTEIKAESQAILEALELGAETFEGYSERFEQQIQKISEANKATLAEYVAHRKIILDLLKKGIRTNTDGKFNREAYIHDLIYPMRKTAEDIEYQTHNLWLIDERLAYCDYISSDIPFKNDPDRKRTDVLFLDQPVAVSDETNCGREYETIVILELKRPMRDDYTLEDNPITQMLGYVDKLSSNKMQDKDGRTIRVGENTQFYLYAVCDITPKLESVAETLDMKQTPDKRGMYRYHDKKHAYIEILSFDKLISDAEKRNKILFDKLGI